MIVGCRRGGPWRTLAVDSRFTPVIDRLTCLRGISTLTGFGLAVEIGDWIPDGRLDGASQQRWEQRLVR
jgi:hypothetical protein